MKTKHTPGPWQRQLAYKAEDKRPPYNVWTIVGNTNADERRHSIVATTITDDDDARLIAAAPELLEACKALLSHARTLRDASNSIGGLCNRMNLDNDIEQAQSAIAKAQGEGV